MSLNIHQVNRILHRFKFIADVFKIQKDRTDLCWWSIETMIKSMKEQNMSKELIIDVLEHFKKRCELCQQHKKIEIKAVDMLANDIEEMKEANGNGGD